MALSMHQHMSTYTSHPKKIGSKRTNTTYPLTLLPSPLFLFLFLFPSPPAPGPLKGLFHERNDFLEFTPIYTILFCNWLMVSFVSFLIPSYLPFLLSSFMSFLLLILCPSILINAQCSVISSFRFIFQFL
jgi:hypothetical protein